MKILILFLLCLPNVLAWDYDGHKSIVDFIYFSTDMQFKDFNLSRLEDGSVAPDKVFRDQRMHHYPESYNLANKWLNNYSDKSYSFGVASHYISDSFVAPHYIKNEVYKDHQIFESEAVGMINIDCKNYNLSVSSLRYGPDNSKYWNVWLKNKKNYAIPSKEINQAAKVALSIAINNYNLTCLNKTVIEEFNYLERNNIYELIILFIVFVIGLYLLNS